jgi:hypothetical protein
MTTAYYSTVLDHPVEQVWSLIRDFNNYPVYIEGVTENVIEDHKRGDEIGAVRRFCYAGNWIRQRLCDHSDENRSLTYLGLDPFEYPGPTARDTRPAPIRYSGTINVLPVVADGRTFIQWSVSFHASQEQEREAWHRILMLLIPDWTHSLKRTLERGDALSSGSLA